MEEPNTNTITYKNENPTTNHDINDSSSFNSDSFLHNGGGGGLHKSASLSLAMVSSDMEMISLQVATYTSLKDLLPPPSPSPSSPSAPHNSSWQEIPIRNPLVKQAARSYLQPMSSPLPDAGDKGLLGQLRDGFLWCWQCQCFSWLNDVLLNSLREVFCFEIDDDEEEEEDYEKVD